VNQIKFIVEAHSIAALQTETSKLVVTAHFMTALLCR